MVLPVSLPLSKSFATYVDMMHKVLLPLALRFLPHKLLSSSRLSIVEPFPDCASSNASECCWQTVHAPAHHLHSGCLNKASMIRWETIMDIEELTSRIPTIRKSNQIQTAKKPKNPTSPSAAADDRQLCRKDWLRRTNTEAPSISKN